MKWLVALILVAAIIWLLLRRWGQGDRVGHGQSLEERQRLEQETGRDEALRAQWGFAEEWEDLIRSHPSARTAHERVQGLGRGAVERLSRHYEQHRDPEALPAEAERIAAGEQEEGEHGA